MSAINFTFILNFNGKTRKSPTALYSNALQNSKNTANCNEKTHKTEEADRQVVKEAENEGLEITAFVRKHAEIDGADKAVKKIFIGFASLL